MLGYKLSFALGNLFLRLVAGVQAEIVSEPPPNYIMLRANGRGTVIQDGATELNLTHSATMVNLTDQEVRTLLARHYFLEPNEERPGNFTTEEDEIKAQVYAESKPMKVAAPSPNLQAPMMCAKCVPKHVSVVLPDSTLFPSVIPTGMKVQVSPPFVPTPGPCNTHGSNSFTELIKSISYKNLNITSVPVFNCGSGQFDSLAIEAFTWIKQNVVLQNIKAGRKTVITYAWGTVHSEALAAVLQDLINLGVLLLQSSGNSGINACPFHKYKGSMWIGGTNTKKLKSGGREAGDQIAANSNRGPCVDPYAPSSIENFLDKQDIGPGTSWSVPIAAARAVCIWESNLQATAQQVAAAMIATAKEIIPTRGDPFRIFEKDDYCDIPVIHVIPVPPKLFSILKPTSTTNYIYKDTYQQLGICLEFSIATSKGASLTRFDNEIGTISVAVVIGKQILPTQYRHSIAVNGVIIKESHTTRRMIGKSAVGYRIEQKDGNFMVMFKNSLQEWDNLMSTKIPYNVSIAGFAGNQVTYKNALTC